jgi:hypothetical protein
MADLIRSACECTFMTRSVHSHRVYRMAAKRTKLPSEKARQDQSLRRMAFDNSSGFPRSISGHLGAFDPIAKQVRQFAVNASVMRLLLHTSLQCDLKPTFRPERRQCDGRWTYLAHVRSVWVVPRVDVGPRSGWPRSWPTGLLRPSGGKTTFKSERSYGEIVGPLFPSMISATHASAPRSKLACWSRASRRPRISDVLGGPGQSALERRARTRCITTAMAFRSSADIASISRLSFRFGWFSWITWDWMPRPSSASRIT